MNQSKDANKNSKPRAPRSKPVGMEAQAGMPGQVAARQKLSRFAWDVAGLLMLALGVVLLLGMLKISQGVIIDSLLLNLARWFGVGRYFIALSLIAAGWLLLLLRKNEVKQLDVFRLVILELSVLFLLGALSALGSESVLEIEVGSSLGGSVGWGLAHPLAALIGSLPAGIVLLFLAMVCVFLGTNLPGWVERWALRRAGLEYLNSAVETRTPEPIQPVAGKAVPAQSARAVAREKPKTQVSLPFAYTQNINDVNAHQGKAKPAVQRDRDLPPLTLLDDEKPMTIKQSDIDAAARTLEQTLADFGIPAKVVGFKVGPTVTQYAVEPGYIEKNSGDERQKIRISQISSLSRDLALALKADHLRIEAPVPGESYVGIEVPNLNHSLVKLKPLLKSEPFLELKSPLGLPLGRDVSGQPVVSDLADMPHLLIAGTTNSGKSICIIALATALIMNNTPDELRLVMIDRKMVELNRFNGLPHLLGQVESEIPRVIAVLRWAVTEMQRRYQLLQAVHARNLDTYNNKMERRQEEKLPRIVILIDELADLMLSAADETEQLIERLAQMARAVGIHLVVATQRPSADVITGVIKANLPTRIAFTVASLVDSRVILDYNGAETLLGKGDMLFLDPKIGALQRAQGVIVSDRELERVIAWWQEHYQTDAQKMDLPLDSGASKTAEQKGESQTATVAADDEAPWEDVVQAQSDDDSDEGLITKAIEILRRDKRASASYFQRQLRVGYPKAAWVIDQLEARGIIGPAQSGGKDREILLDDDEEA